MIPIKRTDISITQGNTSQPMMIFLLKVTQEKLHLQTPLTFHGVDFNPTSIQKLIRSKPRRFSKDECTMTLEKLLQNLETDNLYQLHLKSQVPLRDSAPEPNRLTGLTNISKRPKRPKMKRNKCLLLIDQMSDDP